MNNITKLAKLLTADFFVWEQNKQTNEMKCQNIDNILNDKINLLLKKDPIIFCHTYTSVAYDSGHIIICRVTENKLICFSFVYEKQLRNSNELQVLHSLQNLKTIAQIIFTMYNTVEAPDEDIYILKIDNKNLLRLVILYHLIHNYFLTQKLTLLRQLYIQKKIN